MNSKIWDRVFWGIEFIGSADGADESPILIGGLWHPAMAPRYLGEPSRPILFITRKLAREWCKQKMWEYKGSDICSRWRFRPVRVTEAVTPC